jgi:Zn-dependent protease with chaperone function
MTSEQAQPGDRAAETNPSPTDDAGFRVFTPGEKQPRRRRKGPSVPDAVDASASVPPVLTPLAADGAVQNRDDLNPDRTNPDRLNLDRANPDRPTWRNAPRAARWQSLPAPDVARLQLAQRLTFVAVPFWPVALHALWHSAIVAWARLSTTVLRWPWGAPTYNYPLAGPGTWLVNWRRMEQSLPEGVEQLARVFDTALWVGVTFLIAPYVLRLVLRSLYGVKPLSIARLGQISPEAQQRLQRHAQQTNQPLPQLELWPSDAPIALTYGHFPKTARLVLSQGLLDQLADDEIAAIVSGELRSIHPLNMGLLTWYLGLLQLPYSAYVLLSRGADALENWGDRQDYPALSIVANAGVSSLGVLASLAYIVFSVLRWPGLWFTRQRSIVADHAACNLTGNPNGQARALLKISQGISQAIASQGRTDFLLEACEPGMPVGYRQALTLGSLLSQMPAEPAFAWEWGNGYRHYLSFNNTHALLGGRCARLMQAAQQWQLPEELDMRAYSAAQAQKVTPKWPDLLVAGAPFWGAAIGYGVALLAWAIAWLAYLVGLQQLAWLGSDFRLMYAFPIIGFGVATVLRFNGYFPDLPSGRRSPQDGDDLAAIVTDAAALPQRSTPTVLAGKLLGRRGVANWLAQDLLLQTDRGLVRLHYPSALGGLTNIAWWENRAADLIGQTTLVLGWLRRGATPWMDAEQILTPGRSRWGGHQVWSTVSAIAAIAIGLAWLGIFEDLAQVIQRAQEQRSR